MKVKVLTNINDLDITKETWNALVCENETNTIFQTYDWFQCWWSVYGKDYSLFLVLVYSDSDELMGIAPLAIADSANSGRYLTFVGDGKADYLDFIAPRNKKNILYHVFLAIRNNKHRWKNIFLRNIPACSSTVGLAQSFRQQGPTYGVIDAVIPCPTLIIQNRQNEARSIFNKYSVKRRYKYFNRSGELSHEILNDDQSLDEHLGSFFQQHIDRWDNTRTPSLFHSDNNTAFYRMLSKRLLDNGQLLFSRVKYNNRSLAYHFGFDYDNVVTWYKPTFDPKYAQHSPGTVLTRYLIGYCLDNRKKELDFTVGNESFKNRFTNMTRENVNIRVFTNRLTYYSYRIKMVAKKFTKKLIGRH